MLHEIGNYALKIVVDDQAALGVNMKYVFFEVDGTLNQTHIYAMDAYKEAMKKRNMEAAEKTIIQCIGMTPKAIADHLFGELGEAEKVAWTTDK